MKKLLLMLLFLNGIFQAQAQEEEEEDYREGGFKKENLFTGGSVNASFFNGTTALGIGPYFGYSLTSWADVALSVNVNYISQRDVTVFGDKVRQTIIGPGAFVRLFPVNFLFAQAHFERNFLSQRYIPAPNSGYNREKISEQVNSLLLGVGYSSGRQQYNKSYYFMSISFDVLKNPNSPYVDNLQRTIPVINAGFNVALFQGNRR